MYRWLALLLLALAAAGPAQTAEPREAVAVAKADADKLPDAAACRTRYLYLPDEQPKDGQVLAAQANFLSRVKGLAKPRRVIAGLWAVILDDYQWDPKTWDRLALIDPYFVEWYRWSDGYLYPRPNKGIDARQYCDLQKRTRSKAPIVRADWWFVQSCRQLSLDNRGDTGVGYYDWLALKKRADFEALGAVDKKTAIRLGDELRGVLEQGTSGISQLDRIVEVYDGYGDRDLYLTLDTNSNAKGNTAPANLEQGAFKHQAEEGYVTLPNGLWAFWLGDEKGNRQDSAPDFIGDNRAPLRQGADGRIHICLACIQCHVEGGLRPIDDWARRTLKVPNQLEDSDYKKFQRLKQQYMSDLDGRLERGRQRYTKRLKECCGLTPEELAKEYSAFYYRYVLEARSLDRLAIELGVPPAKLHATVAKALDKRNPDAKQRRRLAPLSGLVAVPPSPIPVTYVEQFYAELQCLVRCEP